MQSIVKGFLFAVITLLVTLGSAYADTPGEYSPAKELEKHRYLSAGINFSGLSRAANTNYLWMIDDDCHMIAFDTSGEGKPEVRRRINLKGFHDCEGIVWIRGDESRDEFAVVEERRGRFVLLSIKSDQDEISFEEASRSYVFEGPSSQWSENFGLEALTLLENSDENNIFIAAKEKSPRKLFKVSVNESNIAETELWDPEEKLPVGGDIAALDYFEGYLWLVDEELERIYQLEPDTGEMLKGWQLPGAGYLGQYEGLVVERDESNQLLAHVVAERNTLHKFFLQE